MGTTLIQFDEFFSKNRYDRPHQPLLIIGPRTLVFRAEPTAEHIRTIMFMTLSEEVFLVRIRKNLPL